MSKLRTRGHKVILARSAGGDAGITILLFILGAFMFFPMYFNVMQSLKPLDELFRTPPRLYAVHPTFSNYKDLFILMNTSWVPFSRYIFNTVYISVVGTFGHLVLASLAAYALAKIKFPGRGWMFQMVVLSLMFSATAASIANLTVFAKSVDFILSPCHSSFGGSFGFGGFAFPPPSCGCPPWFGWPSVPPSGSCMSSSR